MKRSVLLLTLILCLFIGACSGRSAPIPEPAPPGPTGEPTAAPEPGETAAVAVPTATAAANEEPGFTIPADLFTMAANPLAVQPMPDNALAVTALIPLEGGTLTATTEDGSRVTLDIPADALQYPTEITMTPLSDIAELPLGGGLGAAVQLEPDGLRLLNYATLTVEPARPIAPESAVFFGYLANGQDFHLQIPAMDTAVLQLQLLHFSGYGVGSGTEADRTAVSQRQPGSAELRLTQLAAHALQVARVRALLGMEDEGFVNEQIDFLFEKYDREVLQPALAKAGESCEQGKEVLNLFLGFERQRQLLGIGPEGGNLAQLARLVQTVGLKCVEEAYEACVENHDLTQIIPTVLGFERLRQLMGISAEGDDPIFKQMMQLINNCFTFELEFDSVVGSEVDGSGFDAAVRANVTITLDSLLPFKLTGSGVMDSMYYTVNFEGCSQGATTNQGDEFEVMSLNFTLSGSGENSAITGLEMLYLPGPTSESATLSCEGVTITVPPTPGPVWTGLYTAMHLDNMAASSPGATMPDFGSLMGSSGDDDLAENFPGMPTLPVMGMTGMAGAGSGGFVIKDWELLLGELYARRDYDREQEFLYEVTTFNLYHRPPN